MVQKNQRGRFIEQKKKQPFLIFNCLQCPACKSRFHNVTRGKVSNKQLQAFRDWVVSFGIDRTEQLPKSKKGIKALIIPLKTLKTIMVRVKRVKSPSMGLHIPLSTKRQRVEKRLQKMRLKLKRNVIDGLDI